MDDPSFAATRTTAALLERFRSAAWDVAGVRLDDTNLDARIQSLGIDSVSMLEIVGLLEETFDAHLADEDIMRVETVSDLILLIQRAS